MGEESSNQLSQVSISEKELFCIVGKIHRAALNRLSLSSQDRKNLLLKLKTCVALIKPQGEDVFRLPDSLQTLMMLFFPAIIFLAHFS